MHKREEFSPWPFPTVGVRGNLTTGPCHGAAGLGLLRKRRATCRHVSRITDRGIPFIAFIPVVIWTVGQRIAKPRTMTHLTQVGHCLHRSRPRLTRRKGHPDSPGVIENAHFNLIRGGADGRKAIRNTGHRQLNAGVVGDCSDTRDREPR